MGITKTVLKLAAPLPAIEKYDRYLFVGPHPDDIEIGAGATAVKLASMGKTVCFLIVTDGRYGDGHLWEGVSEEEVIRIRKEESLGSANYLGVTDVRFLDFSDGGFYEEKDMCRAIAQVIGDFKPQVIFAPDPCVSSECHVDHLNVGNVIRRLAYVAPYQGIMKGYGADIAPVEALAYYMTAKPTRFVGTTGFFKRQCRSILRFHKSQFFDLSSGYETKVSGKGDFATIELYLRLRALDFGLRSGHLMAEGFRVLGRTHMHCLPEAGK